MRGAPAASTSTTSTADGLRPRALRWEIHRSMSIETQRPTVAEIDLAALRSNFRALRAVASHGELMVVDKADAYGHGAVTVARTLIDEGCRHFGVATLDEARELREAGVRARVYLQAGFFAEQVAEIVALDLPPFVFDATMIGLLDRAAASASRPEFPIHVKLHSRLTRLGATPADHADSLGGGQSGTRRHG